MHNIIELIQEPKIAEQLELLKGNIEERTNALKELANNPCGENLKELKEKRAELKKEYEELEEKRKALKKAIMQPFCVFEEKYKYITESYKEADAVAKESIDKLEQAKKDVVKRECEKYFEELKIAYKVEWLEFKRIGLNITLSTSLKKQKDIIWEFVDKVFGDLQAIGENVELLAEYKKCLSLAKATSIVKERAKAIEKEKAEQERLKANKEEQARAEQKVKEAIEQHKPLQAPTVEERKEQAEDSKVYTVKFTVTGRKTELKALKEFLKNGGYKYE